MLCTQFVSCQAPGVSYHPFNSQDWSMDIECEDLSLKRRWSLYTLRWHKSSPDRNTDFYAVWRIPEVLFPPTLCPVKVEWNTPLIAPAVAINQRMNISEWRLRGRGPVSKLVLGRSVDVKKGARGGGGGGGRWGNGDGGGVGWLARGWGGGGGEGCCSSGERKEAGVAYPDQ